MAHLTPKGTGGRDESGTFGLQPVPQGGPPAPHRRRPRKARDVEEVADPFSMGLDEHYEELG